MKEYQKYEFCKSVNCQGLNYKYDKCIMDNRCSKTAKQFHQWLKDNNFKIVKDHCPKCKSYHEHNINYGDYGRILKLKDGK